MGKLRSSGGYRDSCSFQTATIIYDATYWFCEKYLDPRSRTVDQMVQAGDCAIAVNGAPAIPRVEGRYLVVNGKDGDTIVLRGTIAERAETLHIIDKDYRVVVRGNEIVDIDPPGTRCPIFQHPEYRQDETRWVDVERLVSDTVVGEY